MQFTKHHFVGIDKSFSWGSCELGSIILIGSQGRFTSQVMSDVSIISFQDQYPSTIYQVFGRDIEGLCNSGIDRSEAANFASSQRGRWIVLLTQDMERG